MIKKRIAVLIMGVSIACVSAGCANALKDGTDALEAGDYETAVTEFQKAVSDGNEEMEAEGYRGLGMAYYETGEYAQALEAFQNAVNQGAEQTVQIYNLMGVCAMQTGDYGNALESIRAGLALADSGREDADADLVREMEYNEIICYERQADWENAKQKIAEYVNQYPDDEAAQKEAEFLETR